MPPGVASRAAMAAITGLAQGTPPGVAGGGGAFSRLRCLPGALAVLLLRGGPGLGVAFPGPGRAGRGGGLADPAVVIDPGGPAALALPGSPPRLHRGELGGPLRPGPRQALPGEGHRAGGRRRPGRLPALPPVPPRLRLVRLGLLRGRPPGPQASQRRRDPLVAPPRRPSVLVG